MIIITGVLTGRHVYVPLRLSEENALDQLFCR